METNSIVINTEIWKIQTYIRYLTQHRGEEGSMISLIIPFDVDALDISQVLDAEIERALVIDEETRRVRLLDAIKTAKHLLSRYKVTPPNGLAIFCGTASNTEEAENSVKIIFEPFRPLKNYLYTCEEKFHTEPLAALIPEKEGPKYGFVIVDLGDALYGTLQGTNREVLQEFHLDFHGHSAQRKGAHSRFLQRVADLAAEVFITRDAVDVDGLILAFSYRLQANISLDSMLDARLLQKILRTLQYQAEDSKKGFTCAINLAADLLEDVRYIQEDKIIERLFSEIVNSTRKYCFGLEDTIKFLHAGVIDTLVCWENLDIARLVVRNPETELTTALYLNSEQRRDSSLFRSEDKAEVDLEIVETQQFLLWLAENYRILGFSFEIVSGKTNLGEQFVKSLSGIGATLCVARQDLNYNLSSDASDYEA